jgi:hypothetical protein
VTFNVVDEIQLESWPYKGFSLLDSEYGGALHHTEEKVLIRNPRWVESTPVICARLGRLDGEGEDLFDGCSF